MNQTTHLHAEAFQTTNPTGPAKVPRGVITKLIMAKMEPIKANKMASTTPMRVVSHNLKLISSFGGVVGDSLLLIPEKVWITVMDSAMAAMVVVVVVD